jgi:hypothetical protein
MVGGDIADHGAYETVFGLGAIGTALEETLELTRHE